MRTIPLILVLILAPVTGARAQEQPPAFERGQRVRVTAPDLGIIKQTATFEKVESGFLVVSADSTLRLPFVDVTRLDVYTGRKSRWLRGMWIGFLGGAAVGAVVFASQDCPGDLALSDNPYLCLPQSTIGIGAGVGLVLGAWLGAKIKTDKWKEVPLDHLRLGVVNEADGRLGLNLEVSF